MTNRFQNIAYFLMFNGYFDSYNICNVIDYCHDYTIISILQAPLLYICVCCSLKHCYYYLEYIRI